MATHSSILAWRISMDRGAWRATVHRIAESDSTALSELVLAFPPMIYRGLGFREFHQIVKVKQLAVIKLGFKSQHLHSKACVLSLCLFFLQFLLAYSCCTVLRWFLLLSNVNWPYMNVHAPPFGLPFPFSPA